MMALTPPAILYFIMSLSFCSSRKSLLVWLGEAVAGQSNRQPRTKRDEEAGLRSTLALCSLWQVLCEWKRSAHSMPDLC